MAVFNPQVQETQDPEWLRYSHGTSQLPANQTTAELFKTAGDVLGEGLKGADEVLKIASKEAGYNTTKAEQDDYRTALEQVSGDKSLMPTNIKSAPDNVADVVNNQVPSLVSARANGKLSETAYLMKLNSVIKDTRAQYPGYREYVDKGVEQATGISPNANEYIKSMIGDLNASQTNLKAAFDKTQNQIREAVNHGVPNAYEIFAKHASGEYDDNKVELELNKGYVDHYLFQRKKDAVDSADLDLKESKRAAGDLIDVLGTTMVNAYIPPPSQKDDFAQNLKDGKPVDPLALNAYSSYLAGQQQKATEALNAALDDPKNSPKSFNGRTLRQVYGIDEVKKIMDEKMQPFANLQNLIHNDKFGAANAANRAYAAITSQDKLSLLNDATMGGYIRLRNSMGQMGDQFAKNFDAYFAGKNVGGDAGMKTWIETKAMEFNTGQTMSGSGAPSLNSAVGSVQGEKKLSTEKKAESINELITQIERIADVNTPMEAKKNLINSAYSPANNDMIKKFEVGSSKESVFSRMTSPTLSNAIWEAGGKNKNSAVWQDHKTWSMQTFENVFSDQLKALQAIEGSKDIVMGWDTDKHQYTEPKLRQDTKSAQYSVSPVATLEKAKAIVRSVNDGIYNISSIAEAEGSDPNVFILDTMNKLKAIDAKSMLGLPQYMYNAIYDQERNELAFKEKYKKRTAP